MDKELLKQFVKLAAFLGESLGPDYEVAVHDLSDKSRSIVALANSHISGRDLSAPLSAATLEDIANRSFDSRDYKIHSSGLSSGNRLLRSSTFYIKDESGELSGLFCINFDGSRYQQASNQILQLCHPDAYIGANFVYNAEKMEHESRPDEEAENIRNSMDDLAEDQLTRLLSRRNVSAARLTRDEKLAVLRELKDKGVFLIKGAVKRVAVRLGCSPATLYRYLAKIADDGL